MCVCVCLCMIVWVHVGACVCVCVSIRCIYLRIYTPRVFTTCFSSVECVGARRLLYRCVCVCACVYVCLWVCVCKRVRMRDVSICVYTRVEFSWVECSLLSMWVQASIQVWARERRREKDCVCVCKCVWVSVRWRCTYFHVYCMSYGGQTYRQDTYIGQTYRQDT